MPRTPTSGHRSILILHCDALLLKKQGLYLLEETVLMHVVANMALDGEVETETCDGIDNIGLMDRLRRLAEDGKKFDTVLVIGHSNEDELQVTGDRSATWAQFARYIVPFEPRRLVLAACKAGGFLVARDLFAGLPHLEDVFACPAIVFRDHAEQLVTVAMVNLDGHLPKKVVTSIQVLAAATTGHALMHWSRENMDEPTGPLLSAAVVGLDPFIRELPATLRSLFGRK